jgi:hypothetical protein
MFKSAEGDEGKTLSREIISSGDWNTLIGKNNADILNQVDQESSA